MSSRRCARSGRRGQILIVVAAGLMTFIGLTGLAVDMVYLYVVRSQLVTAVDAAALAAARALAQGNTAAEQQTAANNAVNLLFEGNFPNGHLLTQSITHTNPALSPGPQPGTRQIQVSASAVAPTFFLRIFGAPNVTVGGSAQAIRRDVNLMLVLDRSGSMTRSPGTNPGPTSFEDMQFAANFFVNNFDNNRDRLGLVVLGTTVRTDFAPQTNFKTSISTLINTHIANNSGTNLPDAMWEAYNSLVVLNDPDPLNVIVFFTDGAATAYSGAFNVTAGGCSGSVLNGTAQGFSTTNPGSVAFGIGVTRLQAPPPPVDGDQTDFFPGCGFSISNDLRLRVPVLPLTDSHGVAVTGARPIPFWTGGQPTTRGENIRAISANLTMNVASTARTDPNLNVRVFSIGLGGNAGPGEIPLDVDLLQRIANAPGSAAFTQSEPSGLTIIAPDSSQLLTAFEQVANEIFRLIQ